MRHHYFTYFALFFLTGCATGQLPKESAVLVEGTAVIGKPAFTGWVRDWCVDAKPVLLSDQAGDKDCIPFGGEIYRADLVHGSIVGGGRLSARVRVAFPGHGYLPGYELTNHFVLLPSPINFRAATGINFIIGDFGDYDQNNACILDRGYSHISDSGCKDRSYHADYYQKCVPLSKYLEHYSVK